MGPGRAAKRDLVELAGVICDDHPGRKLGEIHVERDKPLRARLAQRAGDRSVIHADDEAHRQIRREDRMIRGKRIGDPCLV
mgnify:CR=1 FL=1